MTDEHKVRAKFHEAKAQYFKPITQAALERDRNGYWQIYPADGLGVQPIGEGETEGRAWADAASKLPAP